MSALLNLEDVSKRFGFRNILKDINFSINTGEFVMLIGNNGAGKSTLLRIISSLMKPSKGQINFCRTKQNDNLLEWLRIMGNITHEKRLYSDLNSKDNLRIYGNLYGVKQLDSKIDEVLSKIDLAHVALLPVRNFSSGMKKRLMIGRLMLYNPEILILDEPYTGLDQNSFHWFQEYLQQFHQKGYTVLMATHQLALGLELATRVLVLDQQNIKYDVSSEGLSVERSCALLEE